MLALQGLNFFKHPSNNSHLMPRHRLSITEIKCLHIIQNNRDIYESNDKKITATLKIVKQSLHTMTKHF